MNTMNMAAAQYTPISLFTHDCNLLCVGVLLSNRPPRAKKKRAVKHLPPPPPPRMVNVKYETLERFL